MEHSSSPSKAAVPPREIAAPELAMPGDLPPTCGIGQLSDAERQQLATSNQPAQVGRYRLHHKLGEGGFGTVYLADDPQLQRRVAIKVPRLDRKWTPLELENYRREAQVLAQFEHENIVRVFDIGQDELFPVYIVSQFIDGIPLNKLVGWFHVEKKYRYIARAIQFLAQALKYAHERGVVHRDLKPANVMLRNGDFQIFLMDFGLALRDEDTSKGQPCGTPGYASPEQVGGEAHRVDGRSDLYSLGVLLYEMLSGRVPFPTKPENAGSGWKAWLDYRNRVQHTDVRPPRQLDSSIPKELERICLKLLERRASDRYSCAADLLEDLVAFVASVPETLAGGNDVENVQSVAAAANVSIENQKSPIDNSLPSPTAGPSPTPGAVALPGTPPLPATPTPPLSDETVLKIVPKGLRSFDAADKDFFLDLLPGARDREGLPESLRFWKTRIESTSAESTFTVGVLYGPSGCGKSSLLKAGLLPRLSERIVTVYLEATGTDTELRLQRSVQRACDLPANGSLSDTLRAVRQGQGVPSRGKVLLVIDQFEQWLHANRESAWTELAVALRQCDGERLQCLLLVRDDFWLAISRLLSELEVPLLQGVNCAMADLFDLPHARRVLSAFGVAYGALPPRVKDWSVEQHQFLDQSVVGLAQEGKIISVRLALFAEMVKAKPWTPATLQQIGGVSGVGVTFLEETFAASTAPIAYRTHQAAVRGVLKALLPEAGTDIKGHMVKKSDLLSASGYTTHPRDFDTLLHILDRDLRLITPVADEEEELDVGEQRSEQKPRMDAKPPGISNLQSSYQLAHDYLVPSIREWLTKKQRETWRGRAQLRLEERAAQWRRQRQARNLPSLFEYTTIVCGVPRRTGSAEQRRLLRAATWYYGLQMLAGMVLVSLLGGVVWEVQGRTQARRLVQAIYTATPTELPGLIEHELPAYRRWAETALRADAADTRPEGSVKRWRASLALVSVDATQVPFLREQLLECSFDEFAVIRDRLVPYRQRLEADLWKTLRDSAQPDSKRFRAGMALAIFANLKSPTPFEPSDVEYLTRHLVEANPIFQRTLLSDLQPVAKELLDPLTKVFLNASAGETERVNAASALAQYAADDPDHLALLIVRATAKQYQILFPVLTARSEKLAAAQPFLEKLVTQQPLAEWDETQRVELGRQRAGAAITLFRTKARAVALEALRVADDPESLTQFVARCKERGIRPDELLDALEVATDSRSRDRAVAGLPERSRDIPMSNHHSGDRRSAEVARSETGHSAAVLATCSSGVADPVRQLACLPQFGLLLALGEFAFNDLPSERREAFKKQLLDRFETHPSSAIHGACGWLLRHWGFEKDAAKVEQAVAVDSIDERNVNHEWFVLRVKSKGPDRRFELIVGAIAQDFFTFVVFEPGEFEMGSPESEKDRSNDEQRHRVKLTRAFAMLDREVTREQFERFLIGTGQQPFAIDRWSPANTNSPMVGPNWFHCVSLCRWLTTQMGMSEDEQSYVDPQGLATGPDGNPQDWPVRLDRPGVRLPTEAEWEYACRAGTRTAYGFGSDRLLLARHALVFEANKGKTQQVGGLRPNLRGLSDMHGNAFEWCNDVYDSSSYDADGVSSDPFTKTGSNLRVLRGSSWNHFSTNARAACRYRVTPDYLSGVDGVRLVVVFSGVSTP